MAVEITSCRGEDAVNSCKREFYSNKRKHCQKFFSLSESPLTIVNKISLVKKLTVQSSSVCTLIDDKC